MLYKVSLGIILLNTTRKDTKEKFYIPVNAKPKTDEQVLMESPWLLDTTLLK